MVGTIRTGKKYDDEIKSETRKNARTFKVLRSYRYVKLSNLRGFEVKHLKYFAKMHGNDERAVTIVDSKIFLT